MSITRFILVMLSVSVAFIAPSQGHNYYYFKGQKVTLEVHPYLATQITFNSDNGSMSKMSAKQSSVSNNTLTLVDTRESIALNTTNSISNAKESVIIPCYSSARNKVIPMSDKIDVKVRNLADTSILISDCREYNLEYVGAIPFLDRWYEIKITPQSQHTPLEIANMLFESDQYESCSPDMLSFQPCSISFDRRSSEQWNLYSDQSFYHANVSEAWNYSTGDGTFVAIIDWGINRQTGDLQSPIYTYNTTVNNPYWFSNDETYYDDHGTACASIVAGIRNNGEGIAGVAPDAQLVCVTIGYNNLTGSADAQRYESISRVARGISWAALYTPTQIMSCSWGSDDDHDMIEDAIGSAISNGRNGKGCVMVFASGNADTTTTKMPHSHKDVIVVGACAKDSSKIKLSNYGDRLDITAPGCNIPVVTDFMSSTTATGTSMACPMVAGVAALILSDYRYASTFTSADVKEIIMRSAKKVLNIKYDEEREYGSWNYKYGYGHLDAAAALKYAEEFYNTKYGDL